MLEVTSSKPLLERVRQGPASELVLAVTNQSDLWVQVELVEVPRGRVGRTRLFDARLATAEWQRLGVAAQNLGAWLGSAAGTDCDAIWGVREDKTALFSREGLELEYAAGATALHLFDGTAVPISSISWIESFVDIGRNEHGVRLVMAHGRRVDVAVRREHGWLLDPDYTVDEPDEAETWWVHELARTLASTLGLAHVQA